MQDLNIKNILGYDFMIEIDQCLRRNLFIMAN